MSKTVVVFLVFVASRSLEDLLYLCSLSFIRFHCLLIVSAKSEHLPLWSLCRSVKHALCRTMPHDILRYTVSGLMRLNVLHSYVRLRVAHCLSVYPSDIAETVA